MGVHPAHDFGAPIDVAGRAVNGGKRPAGTTVSTWGEAEKL